MNKRVLAVFGAAVVVALLIIAVVAATGGSSNSPTIAAMKATAESFPAPAGAEISLPGTSVKDPPSYTKGWKSSDTIDEACSKWRAAYRGWLVNPQAGDVTGESDPGQSCQFAGPKDAFLATLQVSVFGTDPQPQITLAITQK